jgi:hypothetical protein
MPRAECSVAFFLEDKAQPVKEALLPQQAARALPEALILWQRCRKARLAQERARQAKAASWI